MAKVAKKSESELYLLSSLIFVLTATFGVSVFFPHGETYGHIVALGIGGTLTQWSVWKAKSDTFHSYFMGLCLTSLLVPLTIYLFKKPNNLK